MFREKIHSRVPPHASQTSVSRDHSDADKFSLALKQSCDFETTYASMWLFQQSSLEPTLSTQGSHPPGGNPCGHNGRTAFCTCHADLRENYWQFWKHPGKTNSSTSSIMGVIFILLVSWAALKNIWFRYASMHASPTGIRNMFNDDLLWYVLSLWKISLRVTLKVLCLGIRSTTNKRNRHKNRGPTVSQSSH